MCVCLCIHISLKSIKNKRKFDLCEQPEEQEQSAEEIVQNEIEDKEKCHSDGEHSPAKSK